MSVAALIADMVRAGVDPELIGRTAALLAEREAVAVASEPPLTARQARNARYYDARKERLKAPEKRLNPSETSYSDASPLVPPLVSPKPPSELPPISPTSSLRSDVAPAPDQPKKVRGKRPNEREAARQALAMFVSDENADALVKHREAMGHPLTEHAATLLGRQLLKIPDPDDAAEMILLHGWRGFKPEWYENAKRQSQIPLMNGNRKHGH